MTSQSAAAKVTPESGAMQVAELLALPATVNVVTAARAFGISPNKAYQLIREGGFPVVTLPLGSTVRVPTAALWRALGVEDLVGRSV